MESVNLQMYAPRAYKKYEEIKVQIKSGKIHIKSLLQQNRLKNLKFFENDVLIQYDDNGWSIYDSFKKDETYQLRKVPDDGYDQSIGFSEVDLQTVESFFNLTITQDFLPEIQYEINDIPQSLYDQLLLLHKRNTLFSENARRTIISLFLINAIELADGEDKLHIHEEMDFSCVREANGIRQRFKGPVDFAIGHSPKNSKLKDDCVFFIVEAKTVAKLSEALPQTLAQAATNFIIRKQEMKGIGGSLKVYWCISDGETWIFGYITGEDNTLLVQQTKSIQCRLLRSYQKPTKEETTHIFSAIVYWVNQAINSSKTTSRNNSTANFDEEIFSDFLTASATIKE
ncbi:hypothetical protein HDV01_004441 [Terramyces sp. JEL0728]|nr:hypothetical protein HDV01_004441 [Terramyces sp. JEL0728]